MRAYNSVTWSDSSVLAVINVAVVYTIIYLITSSEDKDKIFNSYILKMLDALNNYFFTPIIKLFN